VIHPTAIVSHGAQLDSTVTVGPYAIIGPHVRIAAGSSIGPHAVVEGHTTLGERSRIFHHASVGAVPQDLKYRGEPSQLILGDDNTVREFATLHIGTEGGGGVTRVGDKNLFMAYSHVAHDCQVGSGCIFANSATLAGHVEVADSVILGGLSAVHQFTRLGKHSFLAAACVAVMDVPPYCIAQGNRAELAGLNTVGLGRSGFTEEQIARIKEAYRLLFRSKLGLQQALAELKTQFAGKSEIEELMQFVTTSKRGLTR
jgi:UDP-N-acetylglucosamine acyltransferase